MRFLLVDETEHDVIDQALTWAHDDGQRAQVDAWRLQSTIRRDEFVVHGLSDSGHLIALPASMKLQTWMVGRLRQVAEQHQGHGPGWFAARVAERIENEKAPAGEPGSIRVGAEDLRELLGATDAWAATLSPAITADLREEQEALYDVTERVGTLVAMTWTEPVR